MRRRDFLALSGSAVFAAPQIASGQTESRTYRMGLISFGPPLADANPFAAAMIRGLEKRGYVVGRNLVLERRGAEGHPERLPRMLEELVASKVDVIYAVSYRAALAAKVGTTLPVVVVSAGDPVATGLVDSLAQPGGHLTGIADIAAELAPKRLQLLKEMSPELRRVAMLWNAGDPAMTRRYQVSEAMAQQLGVGVEPLPVQRAEDFEPALSAMKQNLPQAIFVVDDRLTSLNRKVIFDFAAAHRLPAMYEMDFLVRYGGLMSYGPDMDEVLDRAASLIDRILKGAKPQDLPFELPTRYRFVINLKTAKALGLDVPASLLAQADELIE
jgi:putative tryptophan/tyrosine transport system substrate-binding protein